MKAGKDKVSLGDLVAAAQTRNPAKISPTTWLTLGKYYIGFLENGVLGLIEDLHEYHRNTVDPKELCASISFFGLLEAEGGLKSVLRLATTWCAHSTQTIRSRLRLGALRCLCSWRPPRSQTVARSLTWSASLRKLSGTSRTSTCRSLTSSWPTSRSP